MSEEIDSHDELPQALLGMQGFSAARAQRYRAEISKLLTGRMSRSDRWMAGGGGVLFLITLGLLPVIGIYNSPLYLSLKEMGWTFAATFMATGVLLCGWLLWIAIQGTYGRRAGDLVGAAIACIFCGGAGVAFLEVAWSTDDSVLRIKMLASGAFFFALVLACLLITLLQRMHRQIQERLLRIDYHVAELMARSSE